MSSTDTLLIIAALLVLSTPAALWQIRHARRHESETARIIRESLAPQQPRPASPHLQDERLIADLEAEMKAYADSICDFYGTSTPGENNQ
ncbi:hypothetical protein [Streptomyces sp. 1222.5]|uniref:hypothetical protein n=1 Tax=Streptomyces sp. 1222.5 TaxID=1881026 RepID=UPI003EBD1F66